MHFNNLMSPVRGLLALLIAFSCFSTPARANALANPSFQFELDRYVHLVGLLVGGQQVDTTNDALVSLRFTSDGRFLSTKMEEYSGNTAFDSALMFNIKKMIPILQSSPIFQLPPIPPGVHDSFAISIRFLHMNPRNSLEMEYKVTD